jgi:hypothetical protein
VPASTPTPIDPSSDVYTCSITVATDAGSSRVKIESYTSNCEIVDVGATYVKVAQNVSGICYLESATPSEPQVSTTIPIEETDTDEQCETCYGPIWVMLGTVSFFLLALVPFVMYAMAHKSDPSPQSSADAALDLSSVKPDHQMQAIDQAFEQVNRPNTANI